MSKDNAILVELERIKKANGGLLLAEKVVEAARPKESRLHDYFLWNNATAGHLYRLEQAEQLIRSFQIHGRDFRRERVEYEVRLPQFSPHPNLKKGYEHTISLLRGPEHKALLLSEWARCQGHVQRFAAYLAEAGLEQSARRLCDAMGVARNAIESAPEAQAGN
jgi:hypothetical protein